MAVRDPVNRLSQLSAAAATAFASACCASRSQWGQGKPTFLKRCHYWHSGRGLRRAGRDELACHDLVGHDLVGHDLAPDNHLTGNPAANPAGQYLPRCRIQTARISWAPAYSLRSHGGLCVWMTASQSDLGMLCAVSWLTPQMDGLFLGSPSARRRFIDRLAIAFDPAHVGRLSRYERAYRERGKLLAAGTADEAWLASLKRCWPKQGSPLWPPDRL